jgi:hypothetical protein
VHLKALIPIYRQIYVFKETEFKMYEKDREDYRFEEGEVMSLKMYVRQRTERNNSEDAR